MDFAIIRACSERSDRNECHHTISIVSCGEHPGVVQAPQCRHLDMGVPDDSAVDVYRSFAWVPFLRFGMGTEHGSLFAVQGIAVAGQRCAALDPNNMRHDRVLARVAVEDARKAVAAQNPPGRIFLLQHSRCGWICSVRGGGSLRDVDVLAVPCH